jgi:hypothetical protein
MSNDRFECTVHLMMCCIIPSSIIIFFRVFLTRRIVVVLDILYVTSVLRIFVKNKTAFHIEEKTFRIFLFPCLYIDLY